MNDFLASIDRKRLKMNVIGYLAVLILSQFGPPMDGLMGQALWLYLWLFPIYYVFYLLIGYWRKRDLKK
ncbi:MAG: hypothetical protein ACU0CA_14480 [Paracoccaceae bacterium]